MRQPDPEGAAAGVPGCHPGRALQAARGTPLSKPERSGRVAIFVVAALLVLVLDLVSKALVVANSPTGNRPVRILGGAVYIDQVRNSGAAFSLGTGFTVILTIVALAVIVVILRTARRLRSTGWAISLGFILGGALGNLADRLFRAPGVGRGHVVDWISLFGPYGAHWPIFNLADSGIVIGAILAALLVMFGVSLDGGTAGGTDDAADDGRAVADPAQAADPARANDGEPRSGA